MRHVVFEAQTFTYLAHQGLDEREDYFATAARDVAAVDQYVPDRERVLAAVWLRHAVAHCGVTLPELAASGFPDDVVRTVHALTGAPLG